MALYTTGVDGMVCQIDSHATAISSIAILPAADFKYMKDRVDVMDDEKYVFKYTVVEGGSIGTKLISSCFEVKFEAAAENGTLCKVHIELDTIGDLPVDAISNELKVGFFGLIKAVEAHLIANPDAYA